MSIAIAAIFGASAASAADMPVKAPIAAPPPAPSWTGFYFGGNIGGGRAHSSVGYTANDPLVAPQLITLAAPADRLDYGTDLLGGLQIGYNYQIDPRWVIGLEADFDWTGMKGSGRSSVAGGFLTTEVNQAIEWFGTVRGRLGYLPAPNLLTYATGGFAYGKIDRSGSLSLPNGGLILSTLPNANINCGFGPSVCLAGSSSDVVGGWTVGGGFEYALWQNWTVKAEYLYVNLGRGTVTEKALVFTPGTTPASYNANVRTDLNIVRVGVNYRF